MRSPIAVLGMLVTSALPIAGQPATDSEPAPGSATAFVIGFGLGGGTLGLGGHGYVGATTPVGDFLVRSANTSDVDLDQPINDSSSDIALLYGFRVAATPRLWVRAAAGPSFVHTVRNLGRTITQTQWSYSSHTEIEDTRTRGVALQLDVVWGKRSGVGLGVLGSLNGDRSFALATFGAHFSIGG